MIKTKEKSDPKDTDIVSEIDTDEYKITEDGDNVYQMINKLEDEIDDLETEEKNDEREFKEKIFKKLKNGLSSDYKNINTDVQKYLKLQRKNDADDYTAKINGQKAIGTSNKDLETRFMGRAVWYGVGRLAVPVDKLEDYYNILNIPLKYSPNSPGPKNAWKRATKRLEQTQTDHLDNNEKRITEYMVRKLSNDTRILVKEVKNKDDKRLDFTEIAKFSYLEGDTVMKVMNGDKEEAKDWCADLKELHKFFQNHFVENDIRRYIKRTIKKLNPTKLKSTGSVYFVPEKYSKLVLKLSQLLEILNINHGQSGYASSVTQIPIIQSKNQKETISRKVREDTVELAEKRIQKFKAMLDSDEEIKKYRYKEYLDDLEDLLERKKEYEDMLEKPLKVCNKQIKAMKQQLWKLQNKIE